MCLLSRFNPNCTFMESPDFRGVITCIDCCRFGDRRETMEFFRPEPISIPVVTPTLSAPVQRPMIVARPVVVLPSPVLMTSPVTSANGHRRPKKSLKLVRVVNREIEQIEGKSSASALQHFL